MMHRLVASPSQIADALEFELHGTDFIAGGSEITVVDSSSEDNVVTLHVEGDHGEQCIIKLTVTKEMES